jgi:hypothetical protein
MKKIQDLRTANEKQGVSASFDPPKSPLIRGTCVSYKIVFSGCLLQITLQLIGVMPAIALPPPDDTPEEVLRTEILIQARSPLDGKPLTAAEYAELRAALVGQVPQDQVSPKLRELIFLLQLRSLLRQLVPFLRL